MAVLPLTIDRSLGTPLPVQLAGQVRSLVLTAVVQAGDRLPSVRALAVDLGVSRFVIEQMYDQLGAEGWVTTRRGAGTFVAAQQGRLGASVPRRVPSDPPRPVIHLGTGAIWTSPRHMAGWRRAWREVSTVPPPQGYGDPQGLAELRAALAERLARTRGLAVDADEVVVTHGTVDAVAQVLAELAPGAIGVEDPGYRGVVEAVRASGRLIRDIPAATTVTDLRGMAAVVVTPAHQHPLGTVMSAADRLTLLAAARRADAVVLEDDYDSEFRYDVAPIPALASLDRARVAYIGTASKSVHPGLRLGWAVLPPDLQRAVVRRRDLTHAAPSWPAQRALLTLLRDGWVDRAVRAARRVYAERSQRVTAAMSPWAEPSATSAGMYSTWLLAHTDAVRAQAAARAAGYEVPLLADYTRSSELTGLVIGFGGVSDKQLDQALSALVHGLSGATASSSRAQ